MYFWLGAIRVTSTGLDATSPHCSWSSSCEYTAATRQDCADAICKAQGYTRGLFISVSNNFCTESFTKDSYIWVYLVDEKEIRYFDVAIDYKEAQITAECTGSINY